MSTYYTWRSGRSSLALFVFFYSGLQFLQLTWTRYNPTFLLPTFSPPEVTPEKFGRSTGTGSAAIQTASSGPQPPCLGYVPVSLVDLIRRTGLTAPTASTPPVGLYKTLRDARRKEKRPVVLFPEGTTGNGRAVLRFGEGVLADEDIGGDQPGQVFIKAFRWVNLVSLSFVDPACTDERSLQLLTCL